MSPQFWGEKKEYTLFYGTPPIIPQLSQLERWCQKDGDFPARMLRSKIDLFYSASGPDMFALVTSILQEPNKPEAMTERESESFPPSWTMDLENSSRYSSLFPMNIWDHENQTNLTESRSSYEDELEKASPTELLIRKFDDLQVTCPPRSPPSHEVLKPSVLQNEDFTRQVLNSQSSIVPECSKIYVDVGRGNRFSSQVWFEHYGEHQEGTATGPLGASNTEKPILLTHPATVGIWLPATQDNQMGAKRSIYESPQFMSLLLSPFQQENSIPEGMNTKLYQNQQQNCPVYPSTLFNNVKSQNPAYPFRDSSNCLFPPPGFQQQSSSYNGDKHIKSRSLNLSRAPCVTYQKPQQMNTRPWESPVNSSVAQPFCSQAAPQKCGYLQNCGFSNFKENLKPLNSVACPQVELQAPRLERLGEISRNIPPTGWPQSPPANRFAKCRSLDNAPKGDHAGQKTGQSDGRGKMKPASADPDWTPMDALRNKKKMHNLFEFINPSFLPFYPLAKDGSQIPNSPAFHPPLFSPSGPPFPADLQYDNIPDLSHFINGDTSSLYHVLPPPLPHKRLVANHVGPSRTLYMRLEECYKQWRALERERSKIEADLARSFPGKSFATSSEIPYFRLPNNPSRVDRLIWIQFQEQAKVCILLEKLDHLFGVSIHDNILATLKSHLEDIRMTQARRRDEILNSGDPRKIGTTYVSKEKDILALASAVNKLMISTRKTRTALWCAFQHIVLPKNVTSIPGQNTLDLASTPLQTKNSEKAKTKKTKE